MSSTLAKIFHQAEKTFSALNKDSLKANLNILGKMVDTLTISDFDIDERVVGKRAFQGRVSYLLKAALITKSTYLNLYILGKSSMFIY